MQSTNQNGNQSTKSSTEYSHTQLLEALYFIEDLFGRAFIPFVLLGKTAQAVHDDKSLYGDAVYIGVKRTDFEGSNLRMIEAVYEADVVEKNKYTYFHKGVPIYVKLLTQYDRYLQSPNAKMYEMEGFMLPNPWDKYLKVQRFLS